MATVGKEDKCLLSGLAVLSALFLHLVKGLNELLPAHISVLFDVFLLHSKALEALDELFAVVAQCFEVFKSLEVVQFAKRRVVLI